MSVFGKESQVNPPSPGRHEQTDISLRPIGLFAVGLVLMIGAVLLLLDRVFWTYEDIAKKSETPQSHIAADSRWRGPAMQEKPQVDLIAFRHSEDLRLSSFGWVDQQRNIGRIPIDVAIKMLAERGFPEPTGQPKPNAERPNEARKVQP